MLRLALVENLCGLAVRHAARQSRSARPRRTFASKLLAHARQDRRRPLHLAAKASATFVVEILHNLRDQSVASTAAWRWLQTRLTARGQSPDEVAADRAAARGHRSAVDRQHHQHDAGAVGAGLADVRRGRQPRRANPPARSGQAPTPTWTGRRAIAIASRWSSCRGARASTSSRSRSAPLRLRKRRKREHPEADRPHHVGYYLISRGRFELETRPSVSPDDAERISRLLFRHPAHRLPGKRRPHDRGLRDQPAALRAKQRRVRAMLAARGARHDLAGQRARAQLPQHDSDDHHSAAAAAEAGAHERHSGRPANDRGGADDPVVRRRACGSSSTRSKCVRSRIVDENLRFALLSDFADADAETSRRRRGARRARDGARSRR